MARRKRARYRAMAGAATARLLISRIREVPLRAAPESPSRASGAGYSSVRASIPNCLARSSSGPAAGASSTIGHCGRHSRTPAIISNKQSSAPPSWAEVLRYKIFILLEMPGPEDMRKPAAGRQV